MYTIIVVRSLPAGMIGDSQVVCRDVEAGMGNRTIFLDAIPPEQRVDDGQVLAVVNELGVPTQIASFEHVAECFGADVDELGRGIRRALRYFLSM